MNVLAKIYREVEQIRDREALRLWRLARKAAEHGCSEALCVRIRNEGWKVKKMYPDHLINPFNDWEFAFRDEVIR